MRKLASKLREQVEEAEEEMVDVRREDKTIRDFEIPAQEFSEPLVRFTSVQVVRHHEPIRLPVDITLYKGRRLLIAGPNGVGKTSLLRALADQADEGMKIAEGVKVGYYRQDFSGLDFEQTVYESLASVMEVESNERLRAVASEFLLDSKVIKNKVGSLSEGQKGLLCFARFVLQKPGLLILDEPTNHINFRHLPVIARALEAYKGTIILVSHAPDFVKEIRFDQTLDLGELLKRYQG